jgi:hypothetical protein
VSIKSAHKSFKKFHKQVNSNATHEVKKIIRFRRKIVVSLLGTIGVVLLWRGLWIMFDWTPLVNHPFVSMLLGLLVLILSGFLYKLN